MKNRIIVFALCFLALFSVQFAFAETQGVHEIGGKYYYFDANGAMMVVSSAGLQTIDDVTYYFNADSSIKTVTSNGYKKIDGIYYYMKKPYYVEESKARKIISNGLRYYIGWDGSFLSSSTATRTTLKRSGKTLELRSAAKQSVGGYDTLQGSCTDGTYGYYVLYNRKVEKCKIIKIRLSDNKVIKTSGILKIAHGNGLTYNSDKKCLVAVHNTVNPKRLSVISPSTLKVQKTIDVKIPSTLTGATKSNLSAIKKFGSISYNKNRGIYVILLSNSHDLLFLDKNFVPQEYRKITYKPNGIYQCIDTSNKYILLGLSPGSGLSNNVICVYEWDGTYRFMINVRDGYELESIFHVGQKLYAGFYHASSTNRRNYVYKLSNFVWEL